MVVVKERDIMTLKEFLQNNNEDQVDAFCAFVEHEYSATDLDEEVDERVYTKECIRST